MPATSSDPAHRASFEVRWDDVDLNGHLRGSRYLDYAVTARMKVLEQIGWGIPALMRTGITTVLLSEQIVYTHEIHLAAQVTVSCEVIGETEDRSRWRCRHLIERGDGRAAATVYSVGAWFDLASRRIITPPSGLIDAMESLRVSDWTPLVASTTLPGRT
jgi:acyl-CoA thioester hydrolase